MPRAKLALLAAGLLSGCSLAPAYHPTVPAAPVAFKENQPLPPAGWTEAQPQDATARGPWWQAFNDPLLNDLEARAEKASPTLAAALARYDSARAAAREAAADLYPQISVGGSVFKEQLSAQRPLAINGAAKYTDKVVGGQVDWDLDLWGRVRNEVSASRAEASASQADLASVRLSLQADLADAYFRLRGLDAEKELLDRTVVAYTRAEDLTDKRHSGGVANGLDISRSRSTLASAKAQLSDVANRRAAIEHQIAALVGEVASTFSIAPDAKKFAPPVVPASAPSELLQRRPDVAEAERKAYAANRRIGVARAAWFPSLSLDAKGGWNSIFDGVGTNPASYWTLGPATLLETIFDGGRRAAQVRMSRADYEAAASDYRTTVLGAFQQVEDGLAATRLLAQQSVDQAEAADQASKTEDLALIRYRDGASDYLDVVTAQTAALSAERAALQVQTLRMQAAVSLVRALGGDYRAPATAMASGQN